MLSHNHLRCCDLSDSLETECGYVHKHSVQKIHDWLMFLSEAKPGATQYIPVLGPPDTESGFVVGLADSEGNQGRNPPIVRLAGRQCHIFHKVSKAVVIQRAAAMYGPTLDVAAFLVITLAPSRQAHKCNATSLTRKPKQLRLFK